MSNTILRIAAALNYLVGFGIILIGILVATGSFDGGGAITGADDIERAALQARAFASGIIAVILAVCIASPFLVWGAIAWIVADIHEDVRGIRRNTRARLA